MIAPENLQERQVRVAGVAYIVAEISFHIPDVSGVEILGDGFRACVEYSHLGLT